MNDEKGKKRRRKRLWSHYFDFVCAANAFTTQHSTSWSCWHSRHAIEWVKLRKNFSHRPAEYTQHWRAHLVLLLSTLPLLLLLLMFNRDIKIVFLGRDQIGRARTTQQRQRGEFFRWAVGERWKNGKFSRVREMDGCSPERETEKKLEDGGRKDGDEKNISNFSRMKKYNCENVHFAFVPACSSLTTSSSSVNLKLNFISHNWIFLHRKHFFRLPTMRYKIIIIKQQKNRISSALNTFPFFMPSFVCFSAWELLGSEIMEEIWF